MAEEKEKTRLTHSQLNAGDEYYELCCTPCSKENLNKQAAKYCANCKEYFCVTCVKNHNSFKALSGHVLLDAEVSKPSTSGTGAKVQFLPTELCKHHPMEVVNMYCADEDIVGCSVCFTFGHKSCDDIHYIPEYVQTNFPSQQVHQITNKLTKAIKAMKTLKKQHDSLDDNKEKSKTKCKKEIQKYRDDINNILDQIETTTLAELDARHKDTKQKIDNTKHNIDGVHDELVRFKSEMETDQNNDSQKFAIAKLSQNMIKQSHELQSELSQDDTRELTFTRNTDIMTFLLSIVTLGMLTPPMVQDSTSSTVTTSGKQPQQTQSTESSSASGGQKNKTDSTRQQTTMKPQKHDLYKIVDKSEYNIQEQDDKETCYIWSSCILDNGDILLCDYKNNKLKLVDGRTYRLRLSLSLCTVPLSVCRVSSTEVAVCLINLTIQFVSTCDKLVPTRSLSMKHSCRCMTVIRDKMYVCDDKTTLYIYTLNGELKKTITTDKQGHDIFSSTCDITVSDDEKMIHVADCHKGVITLDTDGNVVWRYSGTKLIGAYGVCTDGAGNVIVCGVMSHNVIQLGPGGQYIGEIVTTSDSVINPKTVCYDRNNHKLIVGKYGNNTIKVFTVK